VGVHFATVGTADREAHPCGCGGSCEKGKAGRRAALQL
jgi:hypothetical protein